jgi:hypothetical protein
MRPKTPIPAVLDLPLARTVNGGVSGPPHLSPPTVDGAIAQLGERVVRNDEVGGSIPPGSTRDLLEATIALMSAVVDSDAPAF